MCVNGDTGTISLSTLKLVGIAIYRLTGYAYDVNVVLHGSASAPNERIARRVD